VAGCYSIEGAAYSPSAFIQPSHNLPRVIRLDTTRKEFLLASGMDHRTIADIVGGGDFFFSRDAAWILVGDTLRLVWSSAFTGAEIQVLARGPAMRGHIRFFSDQAGAPMPTAAVTLARRPCG
jgi:hypothetical protein